MAKKTITNKADGPRGVETVDGETVYLEPGETKTVDVADGHKLYEGLKSGKGEAAADDDGNGGEPGPLDQSIEKLTDHIAGIDDAEELQALIDAETAGKSRAGALAALNERLEEVLNAG